MQEVVVLKVGARRAIILLGVSMAMLFLASALLSTETSAQTTSPEGKIVFVKQGTEPSDKCDRQPCADLWVMDADGTNQTNLTNTPDDLEYQPSWAPSGAQITFVREIPGEIISEQSDIFVMDANGQTPATPLTQTDANEREPDWSPDGTKIAFAGVRNQGWEIVTMDPNGQNEAILTGDSFDGEDRGPDWSPDSTMVVFQKSDNSGGSGGDPWEIWAVNSDGSGDTNLTNHPSDDMGPSWSPDGSEITFTSTRDATEEDPFRADIYVMAAPTTLPPPTGETASVTTSQHSGVMGLAASDLLVRAASAQTTSQTALRRLTTDGLSSEPDWADTPADTTPPKVMSTNPANGAKRIAPGVNVTATFTEAMDPSTINATTFKLVRLNADGTTTRVTAAVSYVATTKKATLNPSSNLSSRRTYKATLTSGAQDLAANALDQNPNIAGNQSKNWKFTVQ
jgi:dipeptidyl aminopeptidase/acylaminoacyl peptidase